MACSLYQKIRKAYYYKVIREAETPVVSAFFQDSKGDFDRRKVCEPFWGSYACIWYSTGSQIPIGESRYLSIIRLIWNHCKKYNSRTVILTVKKYEKHTYRPLIFSSTESCHVETVVLLSQLK